jgi:hypothetical protein
MAGQLDPAAQARKNKFLAARLVFGGVLFGLGLPIAIETDKIHIAMTPWGFDIAWILVPTGWATLIGGIWLWRKATDPERSGSQ